MNNVSVSGAYPMPRIDDLIDQLGKARYVTTLDLIKGYWQVPVTDEARHKMAFATPFGLFQFNIIPFGPQGAPATFQRLMDKVMCGLSKFSSAYLDDLIIFSVSWEEHLAGIRKVFARLQEVELTAKPSKCVFGANKCKYLGHIVGNGVVEPDPSKV